MTCPETDVLLALSAATRGDSDAALRHLVQCDECRATLRALDPLVGLAREAPLAETLAQQIDAHIGTLAREDAAATDGAPPLARATRELTWRWLPIALAMSVMLRLFASPPSAEDAPTVSWAWALFAGLLGAVAMRWLDQRGIGGAREEQSA